MNGIFNTPLLLYKIAGYLPMKDVGRLSLCSRTLQRKVSDYFILFFTNGISDEFSKLNPEFIIRNIQNSKSAKCARMSYICLCALHQTKSFIFSFKATSMGWKWFDAFPPFVLCKWLELISSRSDKITRNDQKLIADGLPIIWDRLKMSEKLLFCMSTAPILVKLLESNPSLGMKQKLRPIITYFFTHFFMHDDFCDRLRKSKNKNETLCFLLFSFCVTEEEKIIKDLKQLCGEAEVDYAGYTLSIVFQKFLNPKLLKGLIRHKVHSVGKLDDSGCNALHFTIFENYAEIRNSFYKIMPDFWPEFLEILRILLEAGEDPCLVDQSGKSAVISLLSKCETDKEVLDLLYLFLEFKVDLKSIKYQGKNLLHLICENHRIDSGEAVNLLLESGIPLNETDNNNMRPFHYVKESFRNIKSAKSETLKALISAGEVLYEENQHIAVSCFNFYVACLIDHNLLSMWPIEKILSFNDYPYPMNIIFSACLMKGHVKVARYLLRDNRSFEPIYQGHVHVRGPLYHALKFKNKEERREFALSIIQKIDLKSLDSFSIEAIIELISDDYPLFKEIYSLDYFRSLWKDIVQCRNGQLTRAINQTLAQGNILIFKEMFKFIGESKLNSNNPFLECIEAENALELLPQLFIICPKGLSYNYSSTPILEALCRMIRFEKNYEKVLYYCEIFIWIEGKMASWNEENRLKVLYNSFSFLVKKRPFGDLSHYFNFIKLSSKVQNIYYEALSSQKFITYRPNVELNYSLPIEILYANATGICPTIALWENVKYRLIKLDLKTVFTQLRSDSLIKSLCRFHANYLEKYKEFFLVIQDMIKFVIQHGEVYLAPPATFTPLHENAKYGASLLEFLISLGHPLDPQDEDGDTPLHKACHNGDYTAVVRLLRAGASRNIMNNKQQTPYQIAVEKNHFPLMNKFIETDSKMMNDN